MRNIIYKDFKLVPDNIKMYDKLPKKGELLYTILYCSYEYLLTAGYGYYKGYEIPKDPTVYDWDEQAIKTEKKYDYVKLAHCNKKVYSCEALFVRHDSKLDTLIKNRDERFIDIDAFRLMHHLILKDYTKEFEDFFKA